MPYNVSPIKIFSRTMAAFKDFELKIFKTGSLKSLSKVIKQKVKYFLQYKAHLSLFFFSQIMTGTL